MRPAAGAVGLVRPTSRFSSSVSSLFPNLRTCLTRPPPLLLAPAPRPQVAHPADGAWKSIQSIWARKSVSVTRQTRLDDGLEAFKASSSSDRKKILSKFAELDKKTGERRKALEERAKEILEGRVKRAEGEEKEEEQMLTLREEEDEGEGGEETEESEGVKTPKEEGKNKRVVKENQELSDADVKLLRQLAHAEQKGYERAQAEAAKAKEKL